MEWSKTNISKAELERKQREYIDAAISMAKRAENNRNEELRPVTKSEIVERIVDEVDDLTEMLEEISDNADEAALITEEAAEEIVEEAAEEAVEEFAEEKNEQFGVFNAEELADAIENGEVSGEGLRQAAEILEEMTRKTETMRKLIEEQESEDDFSGSGEDYGLNGFVNKHNINCRRCGNERNAQFPR